MKILGKIRSLSKKAKLAVAVLAIGVIAAPIVHAEFYPNRPTFDYNKFAQGEDCNDPNAVGRQGGRCGSMEGPVFNSFVNTPSYGDERAFVDARRSDQTAAGSYKNVLNDVTGGSKEVVVRMYIHNNANTSTNASGKGIAKNTNVRLALPTGEGSAQRAVGYISADNATPQVVEDTVDFTANENFSLAYKPGSAIIYSNGPVNGSPISDSVVTTGAPIGHNALDGNLPGCFEYEAVVQVTLTVTPQKVPYMNLDKAVRKAGETGAASWKSEVNAKPGEEVEWMLNTKNTGQAPLTNVVTRDVLPPHVELVPGSVSYRDAKGTQALSDEPLFQSGYNSGRYDPNDNTIITFKTTVLDDFADCEIRVRNVAYAHAAEYPQDIRDDADVIITKEDCDEEPPVLPYYSCDILKGVYGENRSVKFTTEATAEDGASIKGYVYDFGDGESLTTDKAEVEHTYKAEGQYAARVKVMVDVNGETVFAEGEACATSVTFTSTPPTPGTPVTPGKPGAPGTLPATGAGSVAAIFATVVSVSTAAYYMVVRRSAQV